MAGEAALVLKMEARLRDFERQMDNAAKKANSAAKQIEDRFSRINPKVGAGRDPFAFIQRGVKGALPGLAALGAALAAAVTVDKIIQASDAYTQMTNRLKIAGYEGANLKNVFQQLYASAQQNGAPIESLVELFGRLSLVQGQIGLSSEQLIGFTNGIAAALKVQGTSAQEASGALLQLSQALGGGVVRAEEFNSIVEGFPVLAQAAADSIVEAGGSVAKLRQLVADGQVSSKAFAAALQAAFANLEAKAAGASTTVGQAAERISNAFINLVGTFNDTTGASDLLAKGLGGVEFAINDLASAIPQAREELASLAAAAVQAYQQIANAIGAANNAQTGTSAIAGVMRAQKALEGSRYQAPPVPQLYSAEEVNRRGRGAEAIAELDVQKAVEVYDGAEERIGKALSKLPPAIRKTSLADNPVEATPKGGGRKGGGGGSSRAASPDEFAREVAQYQKRTQLLQAEIATLGQSTAAQEKAKAVLDLLNAAKEAGIPISAELQARVQAEAQSYGEAAQQLEDARNRIDQLNQFSEEFGSALSSAFVDAIVNGEKLNVVLQNLLKQLAQMAINSAFQQLFGSSGGGLSPFASLLGGLFGGGKSIGAGTGTLWHSGGLVGGGSTHSRHGISPGVWAGAPRYHSGGIAGLSANEVPAILQKGEMVIPRNAVRGMGGGASGGDISVTVAPVFQGGATPDMARAVPEIRKVAVAAVKEAMARRDF